MNFGEIKLARAFQSRFQIIRKVGVEDYYYLFQKTYVSTLYFRYFDNFDLHIDCDLIKYCSLLTIFSRFDYMSLGDCIYIKFGNIGTCICWEPEIWNYRSFRPLWLKHSKYKQIWRNIYNVPIPKYILSSIPNTSGVVLIPVQSIKVVPWNLCLDFNKSQINIKYHASQKLNDWMSSIMNQFCLLKTKTKIAS